MPTKNKVLTAAVLLACSCLLAPYYAHAEEEDVPDCEHGHHYMDINIDSATPSSYTYTFDIYTASTHPGPHWRGEYQMDDDDEYILDANGEKIKALRTAQGMSMAELSRRASMSDRAIRYIEAGEREPSVDAIQKIAAALGVTTDYFMDDATFQKELSDDQFYADVRKKYGSRGVAQAKKIKEETSALFAGGELSEEDQANFIKEMEALFLDAKEEAKKFTPKKYL